MAMPNTWCSSITGARLPCSIGNLNPLRAYFPHAILNCQKLVAIIVSCNIKEEHKKIRIFCFFFGKLNYINQRGTRGQ